MLRALRASGPLLLDGRLDEADWTRARPVRGFRQSNPDQGEPARQDTEVRVLFDERYLYIGALVRDTLGGAGLRVPDLRRDFSFSTHDQFGVVIDPIGDGRNSMVFATNPLGVQRDQQVTDGTQMDLEWDGLWRVRTELTDSGWTAEMAIPWTTLRYPLLQASAARAPRAPLATDGGAVLGEAPAETDTAWRGEGEEDAVEGDVVWRVNFFRLMQRFNETSGWSPWPRAYTPYRSEYAGRLVGMEPPPPSRNLRVQPYTVARGERTLRPAAGSLPRVSEGGWEPRIGGDLKWAITPSSVLDLTVNTDFAEADVDRQVVNLSRFSVLFPERRQFFLENRSLFATASSPTVQPFFTRRLGLDAAGQPIPIQGGARFTHRGARRSVGALLLRQGEGPTAAASSFAVGRYVQNVGRQSRIGLLAVGRWDEGRELPSTGRNAVLAADAALNFTPALRANAMLSGSLTEGGGEGLAATGWIGHTSNRGYIGWLQHYISRDYHPAAGFVYARDVILTSPAVNLDLRPTWRPRRVQNFKSDISAYVYHSASTLVFQQANLNVVPLGIELRNSGFVRFSLNPEWHRLEQSFQPLPGVRVEAGDYRFVRYGISAGTDQSARYNGQAEVRTGAFYDGRLDQLVLSGGASPIPNAAFTASYSANRLRDVGASASDRTTHLFGPGMRLALNPRVQLSGFYQHNTAFEQAAANLRFAWEFRPLSYLYVVYNDRVGLDPITHRISSQLPSERQLIVKLSYLAQL